MNFIDRKEIFFEEHYPEVLQDLLDDDVPMIEAVEMAMEILEEYYLHENM